MEIGKRQDKHRGRETGSEAAMTKERAGETGGERKRERQTDGENGSRQRREREEGGGEGGKGGFAWHICLASSAPDTQTLR